MVTFIYSPTYILHEEHITIFDYCGTMAGTQNKKHPNILHEKHIVTVT
jgi:hypothetical protein